MNDPIIAEFLNDYATLSFFDLIEKYEGDDYWLALSASSIKDYLVRHHALDSMIDPNPPRHPYALLQTDDGYAVLLNGLPFYFTTFDEALMFKLNSIHSAIFSSLRRK